MPFLPIVLMAAAGLSGGLSLKFVEDPSSPRFGAVELSGLDRDRLELLRRAELSAQQWSRLLSVYPEARIPQDGDSRQPMLGSYEIEDDRLLFLPRFAPTPGLSYCARADLAGLAKRLGEKSSAPPAFLVACTHIADAAPHPPSAQVTAVFPSGDELPMNLLKFYIHFSQPMTAGQAYRRVRLEEASGEAVADAFIEMTPELWDPDRRRFTLLFDPGRIKRGLEPHRQLGVPLKMGRSYRLVIDSEWEDSRGAALLRGFEKRFRVTEPDRRSPHPESWVLSPPAAFTRGPLSLRLDEPLDQALLISQLRVLRADGSEVAGRAHVSQGETLWEFRPREPWRAGAYALRVGAWLEDRAGNNLNRPFDVDLLSQSPEEISEERKWIDLRFRIAPGG